MMGARFLSSVGAERSSALPMRVPNCSPGLHANLAPMGPGILSAPRALPRSNSVLDKFQPAIQEQSIASPDFPRRFWAPSDLKLLGLRLKPMAGKGGCFERPQSTITRGILKKSGFTRGTCKNRWFCYIEWGSNSHPPSQPRIPLWGFLSATGLERKFLLRRIWSGQRLLPLQFPGLSLP